MSQSTLTYTNEYGRTITTPDTPQNRQYLASQNETFTASNGQGSTSPQDLTASGVIASILDPLGLASQLSQWALDTYAQSGDWNYVSSQLPSTPQFQARFPAWNTWSQEGGTAAGYVQYENSVYQSAHAEGITPGLITADTITNFINNKVSAPEVQQRLQDASKAVTALDPNSQSYLAAQELGISKGDLAAYFIDPKNALPLLEQKISAAQIGGAAANAGINLGTDLAGNLVNNGVSQSQAQSGFAQMANSQQLFAPLPGQQGSTMTQAQQVGATFGTDNAAAQQVAQTAAARKAAFNTGGGPTSTSTGFVGAGVNRGA